MADDSNVIIRAEHLCKEVIAAENKITILKDVNLSVNSGASIAILGASGSGKTTLLTLLAGLDFPTSGDIYFQQQHLNTLSEEQRTLLRGQAMGFVFQSFQLLPTLTALENVMLPLEIQYVNHQRAKSEAIEWLTKVGLKNRLQHYPSQLSGGEQQRVAIARAFVKKPTIIFADEMTGNLDIQTGKMIMDLMFALNYEQQLTLVVVTHDAVLAERCAKRFVLDNGILQSC
jgi:putative ABC transport system ATP-binding protein